MGLRCVLGHKWGSWQINDKERYTKDRFKNGYKIGEDIYKVQYEKRECKNCGEAERRKDEQRVNLDRPRYKFNRSELPSAIISPESHLPRREEQDFFTEMREFIKKEKEAVYDSRWQKYKGIDLTKPNDNDQIVGPLNPFGEGETRNGKLAYWFSIDENNENNQVDANLKNDPNLFYGNSYILDTPDIEQTFPAEITLVQIDSQMIGVTIKSGDELIEQHIADEDLSFYLYNILNPVPYERRLDAISSVQNITDKRELLSGKRDISFTRKYPAPDPILELNDYQEKALISADIADDLMLIHGPPGTGKTRTLTAYVHHASKKGKSVLVTAHSNQAVDNLIVGDSTVDEEDSGSLHHIIQNSTGDLSISRVGKRSENEVVNKYYSDIPPESADIVAATTNGSSEFDVDKFDVAVIDEATQATRPATAIPLKCAKK